MITEGHFLNPDNGPFYTSYTTFLLTRMLKESLPVVPPIPEPTKHCNGCGETLPVSMFWVRKLGVRGQPIYSTQCKTCHVKYKKICRDKHREYQRDAARSAEAR